MVITCQANNSDQAFNAFGKETRMKRHADTGYITLQRIKMLKLKQKGFR